jgi:superfamily II DNA or RNA helicase
MIQTSTSTSEHDDESSTLLTALQDLSPGAIYTLAPRKTLGDALLLLRRNPVRDLTWSKDRTTLHMELSGHPARRISISMDKGKLTAGCSCGSMPFCSHVVAALITVKKLASPESFTHIRFFEHYAAQLAESFFEHSVPGTEKKKEPMVTQLVIECQAPNITFHLSNSNRAARWYADPPSQEQRFLELTYSTHRDRIIDAYAEIFGVDAPIVYRNAGKDIPLRYMHDSVRTAMTSLDVSSGVVTVRKVFEDGRPLDENSFSLPEYHFNISAGRIEPIVNSSGWRFWEEVHRAVETRAFAARHPSAVLFPGVVPFHHDDTNSIRLMTMKTEEFNSLQLAFPGDTVLASLILTANGILTGCVDRTVTGELHLSASANTANIAAFCCLNAGGALLPLSSSPFGWLTEAESWRMIVPLKAKKRLSVLIPVCFDLLHCRTIKERNALLKTTFTGEDFSKRKIASEAKWFAKAFADTCSGTNRLLLTDGSGWIRYGTDRRDQATLLEIPVRMFGVSVFARTSQPGELSLSRAQLMPRLHELQSNIEAAGFRMFFNGRTVRTVKWEITLDATRSSIDWFELRPEVRCDGGEVSAAEMDEAMKGGGLYLKNGEFVMLDSETISVFDLFPGREKSRSAKKDVVRIPRLQIFDWLQLRKKGVTVRLSPEDERIFSSLASFDVLPSTPLPERIDATLRHYQVDGYHWLAFLYTHRFGACLADDMGLGKTLQSIVLLAGLHERKIISHARKKRPHLIVVPPTLLFNWESELTRFYPDLSIRTYRGIDRSTDFSNVDVVLTSYGIVQRDAEKLAALRFDVIIFDEAQAVKNIQTGQTGACRNLKGMFSLTLTGTPVENHLGEYYSVMDISVPGLLGDYKVFRRSMDNADARFLETLIRRTRPFLLRRTKSMIASELPPKIETDIYLELTEKQRMLYTKTVAEVKATIDNAYRNRAAGQARIIALTAILRLRQLCLSPEILLQTNREPSPKIDFLVEQLEELFDEGHSVLVFSQFTRFLDLVERRLAEKGLNHLRLDGSTAMGERKKLVNRFQQSEAPTAFLLSLKAGGKGLNLTRATYVFHLDPWWNPAVEDQASDRAHRIGQTAQVTITRVLMQHTIEEKMMELKKRKLALYTALLEDATSSGAARISREDFDYLLG